VPGPRPTPTYLKLLRGNPGKQRLNKNEPRPTIPAQCPEPPTWLSDYAKEEWRHVAPEAFQLHLLTVLDTACFSAYVESYARWRTAEEALALMAANDPVMHGLIVRGKRGTAIENPLVYTSRQAARDMVRYASEFGMTPAARSRIAGGVDTGPRPPSKFGDLLA
jgi:P27 family predicted phage terminase small subunit